MTDNEIIKALECCGGNSAIDCYDCPLQRGEITHCTTELATNALDLINRQKAEIERLREENIKLHTIIPKMLVEAKTEAYKEFAERFEKKIKNVNFTIGQTWEIQCALKQTLQKLSEVSDNA